ncbi:MAG: hypothetical protein AAGG51_15010 [Cyanobacteria bacterium P01_G01_bin.54]
MDSIHQLVDNLPQDNITIKVLGALALITPGHWQNVTDFDALVRVVTEEQDPRQIEHIRNRAAEIYRNPQTGYQRTVGLYRAIDKADVAMATAALANKVGEKVNFLSFLERVTPKPDQLQSIDLLLKVAVEIIAFCQLQGLPNPNPLKFVESLQTNYQDAARIRMIALVCLDGLLPLGTDFLVKVHRIFNAADASVITKNPLFLAVNSSLPGNTPQDKVGFLQQSFTAVEGWMQGFVQQTNLTPAAIAGSIGQFI